MLTAEDMPMWFTAPPLAALKEDARNNRRRKRKHPSRAGSLVLITWGLMGMVLMMAFACNIRAIMLKSDYEAPIDTTEQMLAGGMQASN